MASTTKTDTPSGEVPLDVEGGTTTLDSDVTKPSTTAPGDGPADTTDPTERAVSVPPNPDDEAIAAGTVNAVKPAPKGVAGGSRPRGAAASGGGRAAKARMEEYDATKPDGTVVRVRRNMDTGASEVLESK